MSNRHTRCGIYSITTPNGSRYIGSSTKIERRAQGAEEYRTAGDGGMNFLDFCRACGIIIDDYPPVGRWVRLPTEDKPRHRNGAVKWLVDHGFAQNHATQAGVSVWRKDGESTEAERVQVTALAGAAQAQIVEGQRRAAEKAEWILSQCSLEVHPYLESKGFPDERANVWETDGAKLLVIPMRVGDKIVGCQLIDEAGGKKFLTGQRTSDAAFVINNRGPAVLCEGYATGLSIRAALTAIKTRYTLFVCFSAHNLGRIAATLPKGLVVADNDASGAGERVARETGWPYFMPPEVGMDFNDWHRATSLFKCSQALRSALLQS